MLSSLANQINPPPITVDVSCVAGNGTPTTKQICDMYKDKLEIQVTEYPLETLQYRGLTRNRALRSCGTEWLLFADCDMVYHPEFFSVLMEYLDTVNDMHLGSMFIAGRRSNPIEMANDLVKAEDYSAPIPHPWKRAHKRLKDKFMMRSSVGAGFFQLINIDHCDHQNYYVDAETNRDYGWIEGHGYAKANSDRQFRRRIGACHKLPKWYSKAQIHLNHNRDNGNGLRTPEHLEEQR
jgi:glycosyltransferase involved in cell wall biosynthesis